MEGKLFQTTAQSYGAGNNVELYKDKAYNIHENRDLRALQRRLPKGWKKAKWTPRNFLLTKLLTLMIQSQSQAKRNEMIDLTYQ